MYYYYTRANILTLAYILSLSHTHTPDSDHELISFLGTFFSFVEVLRLVT